MNVLHSMDFEEDKFTAKVWLEDARISLEIEHKIKLGHKILDKLEEKISFYENALLPEVQVWHSNTLELIQKLRDTYPLPKEED